MSFIPTAYAGIVADKNIRAGRRDIRFRDKGISDAIAYQTPIMSNH